MTWDIQILANQLYIDFFPKNEVLSAFIQQVNPSNYAILIGRVSKQLSFGSEFSSAIFFEDLDFEDKDYLFNKTGGIKNGEIWIHQEVFGDTTIDFNLFIKILYDYGNRLIEIYENNIEIDSNYIKTLEICKKKQEINLEEKKLFSELKMDWSKAMKQGLENLRQILMIF